MVDITKHPLITEAYNLCIKIDNLGASPELTDCVTTASQLLQKLDALLPVQAKAETSEQVLEQEIQAKGLTAPRVTPANIDDTIMSISYFTALQGVLGEAASNCNDATPLCDVIYLDGTDEEKSLSWLTFCVLVLKNGFTVTGESACASPENFNKEIGRKVALENAKSKIWALEGYLLKQRLSEAK